VLGDGGEQWFKILAVDLSALVEIADWRDELLEGKGGNAYISLDREKPAGRYAVL
jgi:hypothetical protein